jgi:hypothetical protein
MIILTTYINYIKKYIMGIKVMDLDDLSTTNGKIQGRNHHLV